MNAHGLFDLDSLVFTVRNKESRRLITEAISAYRGGAFRSAIVATWIAVAYDVIAKARELAAQGEAAPRKFISDLDQAISQKDFKKLQTIESGLLDRANEEFQFFAPHELLAFRRLQEDRNLCAHPALVVEDELFQPSPELTRAHIVHAIQYLLAHAPLQGKSAIKRFEADLLSPSFPTQLDEIEKYLRSKYLDRAKDALVLTLIKGLFTAPFFSESEKFVGRERLIASALKAISRTKPGFYEDTMSTFVAGKMEYVGAEKLLGIVRFLGVDGRIWNWLNEATRLQVKTLLSNTNIEQIKQFDAFDGFAIPELSEILLNKMKSFDKTTQASFILEYPRREFLEFVSDVYSCARSFHAAEDFGRALVTMAQFFSAEHLKEVLSVAGENIQIYHAFGTANILAEVFDKTIALLPQTGIHWWNFVKKMTTISKFADSHYSYPEIRARLEKHNV